MNLTEKENILAQKTDIVQAIIPRYDTVPNAMVYFPYDNIHHYSVDNYGPI